MSETLEPGTAMAVIPAGSVPTLIGADKNDILGNLRKELAGYKPDASTQAGRDEIGSKARKVGAAKQEFVRLADTLKEEHATVIKKINAERNEIEAGCDTLRDAILAPRVAYLQIEKDRIAAHEAALQQIAVDPRMEQATSAEISEAISWRLEPEARNWQEFHQRALDAHAEAIATLRRWRDAAERREEEAAELARLRAEQAERDRLAAIETQRVREEQIAQKAADTAKCEAAVALAEAERRAEQEKAVAGQVAARAEEARIADHGIALDRMRKLATPLAPPDPAVVIDSKLGQLDDVYTGRDWEEFKPQADMAYITHQATLQDARVVSVRLAEEAAHRKQADADAAEAKRQADAIEAERARVAEAQRVEDAAAAKRAANRAHQGRINGEVLADMLKAIEHFAVVVTPEGDTDVGTPIVKAIITALARGQVRHTKIGY